MLCVRNCVCVGTNARAGRCGCGFMASQEAGRTDVAFSTGLHPSLAALHLKEEVCVCVWGGPAVPICSH